MDTFVFEDFFKEKIYTEHSTVLSSEESIEL